MTLVVANRISRGIRLVGDSKITDRDAILRGELKGALKIIILEPRVRVAFSGGVNRCLDAIRRLHGRQRIARDQRLDPRDVQDLLSAAALRGQGRDEFLVATVAPTALMQVRADEVTPADQLWIGDHGGFEAYQRHFHEPTGMAARAHAESPEQATFFEQAARGRRELFRGHGLTDAEQEDFTLAARMTQAMEDVIADPSVRTVDGFSIDVKGDNARGFRYQARAAQFGGLPQTIPAGVETPLRFGKPASAGGYGYTYCIPDPGVGAVGVHFPQGRLGALFHPLTADEPIRYRDVNQDEFVSAVEKDHAIRLNAGFGFR